MAHQASRPAHGNMEVVEGRHTRTGAAASRRCDGRGSPWQSVGQLLTRIVVVGVGRTGDGGRMVLESANLDP